MKVEMLTCQAGLDFVRNRGDVVDVGEAEGVRMIEAGIAVPVRDAPPVETTSAKPKREKASR